MPCPKPLLNIINQITGGMSPGDFAEAYESVASHVIQLSSVPQKGDDSLICMSLFAQRVYDAWVATQQSEDFNRAITQVNRNLYSNESLSELTTDTRVGLSILGALYNLEASTDYGSEAPAIQAVRDAVTNKYGAEYISVRQQTAVYEVDDPNGVWILIIGI